jgi:hypothetical protein
LVHVTGKFNYPGEEHTMILSAEFADSFVADAFGRAERNGGTAFARCKTREGASEPVST